MEEEMFVGNKEIFFSVEKCLIVEIIFVKMVFNVNFARILQNLKLDTKSSFDLSLIIFSKRLPIKYFGSLKLMLY